jgi:SAM-dependent methyltransferase
MASADIFVLPSIRDEFGNVDGLPTVLLEAMSSGLPTVASCIGGVDLVIVDNVNGLLVPPGEPQALADALSGLLRDPAKRTRLGREARRSVEDKYNWATVAERLVKLFQGNPRQRNSPLRLGTIYREELLKDSNLQLEGSLALDVGCHDGYWLGAQDIPAKIGVDLHPVPGAPGVAFVQADGTRLPFRQGTFDSVSALDVIEHVAEDRALVSELCRVLKPGGMILITTPSAAIRMFPAFLTGWISRKWGHDLRIGYTKESLSGLFDNEDLEVRISPSNALSYRRWYLPVRFIASFAPHQAARITRWLARKDAANPAGEQGFLLLVGTKLPSRATRE